jgi:hypothetical protein
VPPLPIEIEPGPQLDLALAGAQTHLLQIDGEPREAIGLLVSRLHRRPSATSDRRAVSLM